jgi:hypothetical protein
LRFTNRIPLVFLLPQRLPAFAYLLFGSFFSFNAFACAIRHTIQLRFTVKRMSIKSGGKCRIFSAWIAAQIVLQVAEAEFLLRMTPSGFVIFPAWARNGSKIARIHDRVNDALQRRGFRCRERGTTHRPQEDNCTTKKAWLKFQSGSPIQVMHK